MRDLIAQKLALVRSKIEELRTLETGLAAALQQCWKALRQPSKKQERCPVLQNITAPRPEKDKNVKVEVLFFAGCPNHPRRLARCAKHYSRRASRRRWSRLK